MSRNLNKLDRTQQILRDELYFAYLNSADKSAMTSFAYAQTSTYLVGGETFSGGLFEWELAALTDPRLPAKGRVLLGAAGGGRELRELLNRGYEVYAFEPVEPMVASASVVARGLNAVVVRASYQDLIARSEGKSGPLDSLQGPFDFCVMGWGSLSHILEPSEMLRVLRAFSKLSPLAPVLASFVVRDSALPGVTLGGARKLRRSIRRALQAVGGQPIPPGLAFRTDAGFVYAVSREELGELCAQAGYELGLFSDIDYPHALFIPTGSARGAATSE